jgi:hypothetical protein
VRESSSIFSNFLSLDASKHCHDMLEVGVVPKTYIATLRGREKVYTPIPNKPPPGKPFTFTASTLQHLPLQHLLFGNFAIAFFPFLQRRASGSSGCINRSPASL